MRIRLSDRYVTVLNFVLIAAIAYFAALSADDLIAQRLTAASALEPPTRTARRTVTGNLSRASYSVIAERDVFNSVKQAPMSAAPATWPSSSVIVASAAAARSRQAAARSCQAAIRRRNSA